jgi:hypothetical protein
MKTILVTRNGLACLLVRRKSLNLYPVLLTLLACLAELVHAASAGLDPTFGTGGKVTTNVSDFGAETNSVAIQPDPRPVHSFR